MKTFKILLFVAIMFILTIGASAQSKKRKTVKKSKPKAVKSMNDKSTSGKVKIIAEGSNGAVETPFVFVARSKETYGLLQSFVENLPPAAEIDFSKTAVVAAFAGTKNTGGYSVKISQANDKVSIAVVEPPKDAMTTDALTMPFKVALVSIAEENSLPLEISANWKNAMQTYKVTSGEFESSGGFAGKLKKFNAEGTIGRLDFGGYTTLFFNLSGKNADKNMKLTEAATGMVKDSEVNLTRLDAGSFSEGPKPPLRVSGMMSNDKLSLTFEPLPSNVADGFQLRGKLEASKIK